MSAPLLQARGLEKAFGDNRVLRGVDVQVPPGSVTCLIGPSGSGKTTVLRALNGPPAQVLVEPREPRTRQLLQRLLDPLHPRPL